MRELKFRGISIVTGEWVYGGGIDTQRDTPFIINHGERYLVDADTIGQFTGLHDVHGTEIYAGDELFDGIDNDVIEWCNESASFVVNDGMEKHTLGDWVSRASIVNNIHQQRTA